MVVCFAESAWMRQTPMTLLMRAAYEDEPPKKKQYQDRPPRNQSFGNDLIRQD
jgi:hypothetical protein